MILESLVGCITSDNKKEQFSVFGTSVDVTKFLVTLMVSLVFLVV